MKWIKVREKSLFRLMDNDIQLAFIVTYGSGWYGGIKNRRYGNTKSLSALKKRILFDLFIPINTTIH